MTFLLPRWASPRVLGKLTSTSKERGDRGTYSGQCSGRLHTASSLATSPLLSLTLGLLLTISGVACSAAQPPEPSPQSTESLDGQQGLEAQQNPSDTERPGLEAGRGWLGVGLTAVEGADAAALGFDHDLIQVDRVFPGSPAESSEFQVGDIILSFQGEELSETSALVERVGGTAPGTQVDFVLIRAGERVEQPLMLSLRPEFDQLVFDLFLNNPAPALVANSSADGSHLAIEEGSVVLLDFWATWCGPCRAFMPHLNDLQARYGEHGLQVIGISNELPEEITAFLVDHTMDFSVGYDLNGETNRDYWVTAYPTIYVIDRGGVIRGIHVGGNSQEEIEAELVALLGLAAPVPQAIAPE